MKPCALALFLLASQSACAHVYEPAVSPSIKIRGDGALVKGDRKVTSLADAVRGNPEAEAEAQLSNRAMLKGSVFMVGGSVTLLGGMITGYSLSAGQKTLTPASTVVLLSSALVGFGAMLAGALFMSNGERYGHNAINIYNDGLLRSPAPAAALPAPR